MGRKLTTVVFRLNISQADCLQYYRGVARSVVVTSEDGRTVSFPANVLRRFLGQEGIQGTFVMRYDENNRFAGMERLAAGEYQ